MDKFQKWQDQDHSNKNRAGALALGALIFPLTIPAILVFIAPIVDHSLGIGSFHFGWGNIMGGALAIVLGGTLGFWTIVIQVQLASGTPFPMLPTKKLLIVGPFRYCRNPMTLGTVIAYLGISLWIGSYAAIGIVAIFTAILIGYLKGIEEKELELRFGNEYLEYKKRTPFIFPISRTRLKK